MQAIIDPFLPVYLGIQAIIVFKQFEERANCPEKKLISLHM